MGLFTGDWRTHATVTKIAPTLLDVSFFEVGKFSLKCLSPFLAHWASHDMKIGGSHIVSENSRIKMI